MLTPQTCEAALGRLGIRFHRALLADGAIFFCRQADGTTFDLLMESSGLVRVWRFLESGLSPRRSGGPGAWQTSRDGSLSAGFELTDEGDLCCFAQQRIPPDARDQEARVARQLAWFTRLLELLGHPCLRPS